MSATFERTLRRAVIAAGFILFLSYLALAIIHLGTLYDVNQTSGAWLSFAYYFDHGVLYPPPAAGGYYAGTRYFPGFFMLHALLAKLTGEYLTSGKLLTLISTLVAVGALATIVGRKTHNAMLGAGLAFIMLGTYIGHKGSLTIRGDVLPLALSLVALAIIDRESAEERGVLPYGNRSGWGLTRGLIIAAVLAGLAPLAKFTSFHALTAGFLYLLQRDRRRALVFGAAGFAVFVLGVFLTNVASDGRFFANLAMTAVAPKEHARTFEDAISIYLLYVRMDRAFLLLLPFAFFSLARAKRPFDLFRIYFLLHLVISVGFFFDTGAEYNHLIDLLCASVILASELLMSKKPLVRAGTFAAFGLAAAIGFEENHLAGWTAPERGMSVQRFFDEELGLANKKILAHDPTVSVLMGERPIVADDFQYRVQVMRDAVQKDELPNRIAAREFERIVLLNPAEPDPEDPEYKDRELGPYVARAIREHYALERHVGKFYVYRPRE